MKEHEIFVLVVVLIYCIVFFIVWAGFGRSKKRIDKEIKRLENNLKNKSNE